MEFPVLPPEINSVLMYSGAGSSPLLAAAAAWDGLAEELGSAAVSFGQVTSGLTAGVWQGAAAAAMAAAAAPYAGWLNSAATQAVAVAGQARAAVGAFEAALAATVDPVVIAANRMVMRALAMSNLLGQNTAAIAAAEAEYELMWAQDVAAMAGYHAGASAAATALPAFSAPAQALGGGVGAFLNALFAGPAKMLRLNAGLGNVGNYNVGLGNVGEFNLGAANVGGQNLGAANAGSGNFGFGNVGNANFGFGNSGLGLLPGVGNIGLGNAGSANYGFANMGSGNFGFANTGNNNIGIGLTGNNLTGIGGLNSGTGNIGLFNSGTGNVGFFNSGTGNFGLFNSGSYNTGIGNSGTASTGWFNGGGFNTGVANPGSYNTGSFNAGNTNTGDFNPGSINTGWLNTGNINTGIANSGNVNTGLFISGNYSNGALWVGDYQGLFGLSGGTTIPEIPIGLGVDTGVGPITIQPIQILPTIPLDIHQTINLGPVVVPDIVIPAFGGGTGIPISLGPLAISPITLFAAQNFNTTFPVGPLPGLGTISIPEITITDLSDFSTIIAAGPIFIDTGIQQFPVTIDWHTPALTLFPNGISIPDNPLALVVNVSLGTPGFTIPGFTIPAQPLPVTIDIEGQIDGFSTPPITIDRIPVNVGAGINVGPIPLQGVDVPAVPGFGNTTSVPSQFRQCQHRRLHQWQRQQRHLVARQLRGAVRCLLRTHDFPIPHYHARQRRGRPPACRAGPGSRPPLRHHQRIRRPGSLHHPTDHHSRNPRRRPGIGGPGRKHHRAHYPS
ncbi:PPE family protein [Mycobacterium canetti]|uniref:PPE family protein n=1 Tax=Mycobacterium canetti TaxID=78331 RepID=UPI00399D6B13